MVIDQDSLINIVKRDGPILPMQFAKKINTDSLIASAHLSNLVDNKKIKISNIKVGGSPLYYTEGQEAKLQNFIINLNEKDQNTLKLLKSRLILRDDAQDPLTRVSLRTVKDFAIPLDVTMNNEKIMFWKWYLISNNEAEGLIKKELKIPEEKPAEALQKQEIKPAVIPEKEISELKKMIEEEKKTIENERKKIQEERKKLLKQTQMERQSLLKEVEMQKEKLKEKITEMQKQEKLREKASEMQRQKERIEAQKTEKSIYTKEAEKFIQEKKAEFKKEEMPAKKEEDAFLLQLNEHFRLKNIKMVDYKIIKKKSEIDLVLKIPSVVGELDYFCKAKNKKSITENDLSAAVVSGQMKRLPVLLLTTGSLNKKAVELMKTEFSNGIVINRI